MTKLAPTVEAFFTQRLAVQRDASPHTVAAYRDTLRLLLVFAHHRTGTPPSRLDVGDIDATLVAAFLTHLETERGTTACPPATPGSPPSTRSSATPPYRKFRIRRPISSRRLSAVDGSWIKNSAARAPPGAVSYCG